MNKANKNSEKITYIPKGYGRIVALLITLSYFILVPRLVKNYLWPRKIENPNLFFILGFTFVHEFIYIICNVSCFIIYKLELEFFERYKVHEYPWPWYENREEWIKLLKRSALVIGFNQFIIVPLVTALQVLAKNGKTIRRLDYESLPSTFEICWQMCFFMLAEDFMFYWSHRILHLDSIYPYIHKIHHEYKNTVSISSEHAHFLEFIFGNILPTSLGPSLLGAQVHCLTNFMWIIIRIVKTTDAHSGYQFSWSPIYYIPFTTPSEFHNYHHQTFKGNYGSFFRFWDEFCGTISPGYRNTIQKMIKQ